MHYLKTAAVAVGAILAVANAAQAQSAQGVARFQAPLNKPGKVVTTQPHPSAEAALRTVAASAISDASIYRDSAKFKWHDKSSKRVTPGPRERLAERALPPSSEAPRAPDGGVRERREAAR